MAAGEKFVPKGEFERWVAILEGRLAQLQILAAQIAAQAQSPTSGSVSVTMAAVSNPPTDAELEDVFNNPTEYFGLLQDTDGPRWIVAKSDGDWYYWEGTLAV